MNIGKVIEGLDSGISLDLQCQDSLEVFHYDGDYHDRLLEKTQFLEELARMMLSPGFRDNNSLLDALGLAHLTADSSEEDEEDRLSEEDIRAEVLRSLKDDPWAHVEENLDMWDRKKGLSTLTSQVRVPVWALKKAMDAGVVLDERWSILP
jgi:hypothetical protein